MKRIIILCALLSGCAVAPDFSISVPPNTENIGGEVCKHLAENKKCIYGWTMMDIFETDGALTVTGRCSQ